MKMKEACQVTSLTERAIRLYLSKNLIAPGQRNGIIHFSADDIRALKDISALRQYDFSIEQISAMLRDPLTIPDMILYRLDKAVSEIEHAQAVNDALCHMKEACFNSVHEFVARLNERGVIPPEPNFARFDEISEETRQQEIYVAQTELARGEKKARRMKKRIAVCSVLASLLIVACIFLSHTRFDGFISLAPITIVEKHPSVRIGGMTGGMMTISIDDPLKKDIIGKDAITVPYEAYGLENEAGETISRGVQLAIELTNYDLIRLGINPLQSFHLQGAEVYHARLRVILRTLFADSYADNARLWIGEISNRLPLFY